MSTDTEMRQATPDSPARNLRKAAGAELLGACLLIFVPGSVAAAISLDPSIDPLVAKLAVALSFGFVLFLLITWYGDRSGANFNPAISFGLWRHKQLGGNVALIYIIAQFLGAIAGAFLIRLLFIGQLQAQGFGAATPADDVGIVAAVAVEFFGTAVLTYTVATATSDGFAHDPAVTIGSCLGLLVLFGEFFTGGAYNPARAFGPLLATGQLQYAWYLIPEFVGGWLGVKLFMRGFRKVEQPAPPADAEEDAN